MPGETQSAPSAGCSQAVGNWGRVGVRAFRAADWALTSLPRPWDGGAAGAAWYAVDWRRRAACPRPGSRRFEPSAAPSAWAWRLRSAGPSSGGCCKPGRRTGTAPRWPGSDSFWGARAPSGSWPLRSRSPR